MNEQFLRALPVLALLVLVGSILYALWCHRKTRRVMQHLGQMLDAAIGGTFSESVFDESSFSSIESKMAQYLSASSVSAMNLTQEKDKIKGLIADISHQTKTPLSNVLLYTQLLAEQSLPKESATCLAALSTQAEKLQFLIDTLVKTSRLEAGILTLHPRESEIAPMLQEIYAQIAPVAEEKGIVLQLPSCQESAYFDAKWTGEAIYNLVDNAVKYTPPGGSISFNVTPYELFCRIDIIDSGIGIAEEEQANVFRRFYRSPHVSDTEGVGIGLYLARQILAEEGGYIKLHSVPGRGSKFSVFLPQDR